MSCTPVTLLGRVGSDPDPPGTVRTSDFGLEIPDPDLKIRTNRSQRNPNRIETDLKTQYTITAIQVHVWEDLIRLFSTALLPKRNATSS